MNSEIFRLATILYADNNYEVSPKTIQRKVVESLFIENKNLFLGIHTLIDLLKSKYTLNFTEDEIHDIVKNSEYFNTSLCKIQDLKITLTSKRYDIICSKINYNNLDYFISEFHKINIGYQLKDLREVIYKFLYEIFQINVTSFSKLIDPKIELTELININDYNFQPLEIEIINGFLNWENSEKNKNIFNISNLALEYCLLTNKRGTNFKLENLKNKNFYLDTNIIFRAIGLNGENRKNRTLTFLEKFKEAKESLFISKFTDFEIKKTIDHHVNQVSKYSSARINSQVFNNFSRSDDFIDYYHRWRRNRSNDSLDLFKSHINAAIESLKLSFNIKDDYKDHYDEKDNKIEEKILDNASKINSYKNENRTSSSVIEASVSDAKNIFMIESLRNGHFTNIFDCKYYFISSDQILRRWDYTRSSSIPIVLLPSQWMGILLRYLNRTDDDFKSFVSFLNINSSEKGISNENLQLILNGISEITSDFEQQSGIISQMINERFKGILGKNYSDEEIISKSTLYAKSKLEKDVDSLIKQNERLENKFEKYQENTSNAIETLKQTKDSEKEKKNIEIEKNNEIRKELIETKARLDFNKYKSKAYYCIPIVPICIIYFILLFCFQNSSWNMVAVYTDYANSLKEGSMQKEVCKYIWLLPAGLFFACSTMVFNRLISKENRSLRLNEFIRKWTEEIER